MKAVRCHTITLEVADLAAIERLLREVLPIDATPEDESFQAEAAVLAHELPRSLRSGLRDFHLNEPAPVCLIRGFVPDQRRIGPTPLTWRDRSGGGDTRAEELFFYLCATLLGEPVCWSTKQNGRIVHDIVPEAGNEHAQLGSSSRAALTWHTEDGFHPERADYLGLMCLRNPDRVATTVGTLDDVNLPVDQWTALFEDRFEIVPDGSHFQPIDPALAERLGDDLLRRGRARLAGMRDMPSPVPLLFGSPDDPYLRLDEHFARPLEGDVDASAAFAAVTRAVGETLRSVVLQEGDVCFIDNYHAVHGRAAFEPRFDGTDRWLKRLNIVRDMRRSRAIRAGASSRVLV